MDRNVCFLKNDDNDNEKIKKGVLDQNAFLFLLKKPV